MTKRITIVAILSILAFVVGCDKMGITKSNDEVKKENLMERMLDHDQTATMLQKQIADLESENLRLNSIIAENDVTIKSLQGQLASAEALNQNMMNDIKSSKKTKAILSVVAVISLIFNALFLWMIFGDKKHETRLALPPAREESKKDIDIMKYSPDSPSSAEKNKENKTEDSIKKAQMASGKISASAKTAEVKKTLEKKPTAKKPATRKPTTRKPAAKKQDEPKTDDK